MATLVDDYSVYLQNTFDLVSTMTIKSSDTAKLMNDYLVLEYGEDSVDPHDLASWRYYKNIAGEYHDKDVRMSIVSLDTLEPIVFNKATLAQHTTTYENYLYGTRYYNALVSQYPNQESLILGILYPADKTTAINAADGTILSHQKNLVESQEITLIDELSTWLQRFYVRWYVGAFALSDDLYPTVYYAAMVMNIVAKVLNLRLKRCKTNEAHTFHIRQYLASHGRLDRYMDYMTLRQVMFLYRNINYIEHHVGQANTFSWLIEHLLSPRYIPIANYTMKHLNKFLDAPDHRVEYTFKKTPLNTQYNVPEKDYFDLEELLEKENPLAPWNPLMTDSDKAVVDAVFRRSPSAIVQTKDLESTMVDYTDAVPHPIATVVINHWIYLSMMGWYTATIVFNDPITNEVHTLSAQDAYIYITYLTLKAGGLKLQQVPDSFYGEYVRRLSPLNDTERLERLNDLMSVADYSYYGTPTRQRLQQEADAEVLAALIMAHPLLTTTPIKSTSSFFRFCSAVFNRTMAEWFIICNQENQHRRGMLDNMIRRQYADVVLEPTNKGMVFEDWLAARNIADVDLTLKQTQNYIKHIFTKATGYYVDPRKIMANIQKAMVGTLTQLSSYSIQIIASINEQPITLMNNPTIRLGVIEQDLENTEFLSTQSNIVDYHTYISAEMLSPINVTTVVPNKASYQSAQHTLNVWCDLSIHPTFDGFYELSTNTDIIGVTYPNQDPDINYSQFMIGYENLMTLTQEQLSNIKDIWTTYGN